MRFEDIHFGAAAFVAPYWIDNDPSIEGNVSYSVVVRDNELLQTVSNYIAQSQRISFNGTWMLIAYWLDVPEALLKQQVRHWRGSTLSIMFAYTFFIMTSHIPNKRACLYYQ